jgi:cell division protein FtsI/penicillin-binding protein 2
LELLLGYKNIQEPEQGSDLYLSIDLDLQKKAESLLKGRRGSIVAVDVRIDSMEIRLDINPNKLITH